MTKQNAFCVDKINTGIPITYKLKELLMTELSITKKKKCTKMKQQLRDMCTFVALNPFLAKEV